MKFSKNIYLDDEQPIDAELKSLSQNDLRNRLRTGHILHNTLGEALALSLSELLDIPDDQCIETLIDILQHHHRLQQRKQGKPVQNAAEPPALVSVQEPAKTNVKHRFTGIPGV